MVGSRLVRVFHVAPLVGIILLAPPTRVALLIFTDITRKAHFEGAIKIRAAMGGDVTVIVLLKKY